MGTSVSLPRLSARTFRELKSSWTAYRPSSRSVTVISSPTRDARSPSVAGLGVTSSVTFAQTKSVRVP